jgi:hypothetical protein
MNNKIRLLTIVVAWVSATLGHRAPAVAPLLAQSVDPCASIRATTANGATAFDVAPRPPKTEPLEHDDRWSHLESLWAHRAAVAQDRLRPLSANRPSAQDVGEVAVLQDNGDLVTRANRLDLGDTALRLTRNARGGYDAAKTTYGFRQPLGTPMTMADDDMKEVTLPFAFSFFGQTYDRLFVNSDGNLTFGAGDVATTDRSISRFLTGPPRIAAFFADLDPSAGGTVLTSSDGGAFTTTWCTVREFDRPSTATVQVSLLNDGAIEIQVSGRTTMREAIVGLSPGATTDFLPVDLNTEGGAAGGTGAVGEQFTNTSNLDIVATAQKFLSTHPDEFDNLVIFTDTELLTGGAFAYEVSVSNSIKGTNLPAVDDAREYGSQGRLQSLCNMDALSKYPDDPFQKFLGENSTVSVLGQEVGHRWLAFLLFRDHLGRQSSALLGRDTAHWSFFFDSDGSVLEGNDIVEVGDGTFRTAAAVERFSLLDQYAMGLIDQSEVPATFYVENPINVTPRRTSTSKPEVGVTFSGTKRVVTIDDIVAVLGRRAPSAAESPRVYRQAFVYVVSAGGTADPAAIAKVDRIRVAWEQFFSAATESRMRAETKLVAPATRQ